MPKQQKELTIINPEDFIGYYMVKTHQESVPLLEVDQIYYMLKEVSKNEKSVHIFHTPNNKEIRFLNYIPLFKIEDDEVKLLPKIELIDIVATIINDMEPTKKQLIDKAVKKYKNYELGL